MVAFVGVVVLVELLGGVITVVLPPGRSAVGDACGALTDELGPVPDPGPCGPDPVLPLPVAGFCPITGERNRNAKRSASSGREKGDRFMV